MNRDGRVSEKTTKLVRLLLNLSPHQRLKAGQVVDLLDSTIATNLLDVSSSLIEKSSFQVRTQASRI